MKYLFLILLFSPILCKDFSLASESLKLESWNGKVKDRINELIKKKQHSGNYAVFDFDDTMVSGDILKTTLLYLSESKKYSFKEFEEKAALPFHKNETILDYFGRLCTVSVNSLSKPDPESYCLSCIPKLFDGFRLSDICEIGLEILKNNKLKEKPVPYKEMKELIAVLKKAGIETFVITASVPWISRLFIKEFFGIDGKNVFGNVVILRDSNGNIYSDRKLVEKGEFEKLKNSLFITSHNELPVVAFEGKTGIIRKFIEQRFDFRRPILVAGDSNNDLDMLRYAAPDGCRLFIDSKKKYPTRVRAFYETLVNKNIPEKNCWLFQKTVSGSNPKFSPEEWLPDLEKEKNSN